MLHIIIKPKRITNLVKELVIRQLFDLHSQFVSKNEKAAVKKFINNYLNKIMVFEGHCDHHFTIICIND
jgi:hypothetical protein